MRDRTILNNARNILLVTASSFCLALTANALPESGRLRQEHLSTSSSRQDCNNGRSAREGRESEEESRQARRITHTPA